MTGKSIPESVFSGDQLPGGGGDCTNHLNRMLLSLSVQPSTSLWNDGISPPPGDAYGSDPHIQDGDMFTQYLPGEKQNPRHAPGVFVWMQSGYREAHGPAQNLPEVRAGVQSPVPGDNTPRL